MLRRLDLRGTGEWDIPGLDALVSNLPGIEILTLSARAVDGQGVDGH
jgi:hypothetical protein